MVYDGSQWRLVNYETPPQIQLEQQVAQTGWTTSTFNDIQFPSGTEIVDDNGLHDVVTNNPRVNIGKYLGWWEVGGSYTPAANTVTTMVRAAITFNGTRLARSFVGVPYNTPPSAVTGIATPVVRVKATNAADYVTIQGYMSAASGTIGTAVSSDVGSSLQCKYVGPG